MYLARFATSTHDFILKMEVGLILRNVIKFLPDYAASHYIIHYPQTSKTNVTSAQLSLPLSLVHFCHLENGKTQGKVH
jgi:hypothetical protein